MQREPFLEFVVIGDPATKGSVTAFIPKRKDGSLVRRANGEPMVVKHDDTGAKGKSWSASVSGAAFEAMIAGDVSMVRNVPLVLHVDFYQPRIKGHFRTGKNAHLLRDDAPPVPNKRPDVDKLLRAVLDALSNVVYADDGQIASVVACKHFGEPARAEVRIARFTPEQSEGVPEDAQMSLAAA